jgi:hypothetical protein
VITQFDEFCRICAVAADDPFTVTEIVGKIGLEEVLAATENGIVTDAGEAVPEVAPVKDTGEAEDTLQVHPVEVKLMVRSPLPPWGRTETSPASTS